MKHIVAAGVVLPFPAQDVTEADGVEIIDLTEEQEAAFATVLTEGGVLLASGEVVLDAAKANALTAEAVAAFAKSGYAQRKAEEAEKRAKAEAEAREVMIASLSDLSKSNNGGQKK